MRTRRRFVHPVGVRMARASRGSAKPPPLAINAGPVGPKKCTIVEASEIERVGMAGIVESFASLALRAQLMPHNVSYADGWLRASAGEGFTWLPKAVTMSPAENLNRIETHFCPKGKGLTA